MMQIEHLALDAADWKIGVVVGPSGSGKTSIGRAIWPDVGIYDGDTDGSSRAKAKALLMHYENSTLKLEMALRRGLRFERAAVRRESAGLGAILRAGIERVIDQTAPRLAACANDLQRRQILDKEIARLRHIIKRELPRALRRMRAETAKQPEATA